MRVCVGKIERDLQTYFACWEAYVLQAGSGTFTKDLAWFLPMLA